MAAIGTCWATASWADPAWAANTWAGGASAPTAARTGKYQPEWASALADVAAATGFDAEHTSALADVGDAGGTW